MKPLRSWASIVVAVLVILAFVLIMLRWAVVMDLAADVDTHRLTAEEEIQLLAKKSPTPEEKP